MTKSHRPDLGKRPDKILRETAPLPPEPLGAEATTTGTVKFFLSAKGWGAIETDVTTPWDIWVHFGRIEEEDETGSRRALVEGEQVVVHYIRQDHDSFKYMARSVRRALTAEASGSPTGV